MRNLWIDLPNNPPYILSGDSDVIQSFSVTASSDHHVHLDLYPEPYLGNPNAPVVLLNLNPGYDPSDHYFHTKHAHFIDTCQANLYHETSDYPFYLLDPGNSDASGYKWWTARLRHLIEACGQQRVAQRVFVIEYFGYHSRRFGQINHVPSQEYGFYLLRKAMERNVIIVQMRGKQLWHKAVRVPNRYKHYYELNSPQAGYISPRNCPEGIGAIVEAIQV